MDTKKKLEAFSAQYRELKNDMAKILMRQKSFDEAFMKFIEEDLKVEGDVHGADLILKAMEAAKNDSGLILPG